MKPIKIHTPTLPSALPAHEHAARRRRTRTENLPAIPGYRSPRTPKPAPQPVGARRTFDTRLLEPPTKF